MTNKINIRLNGIGQKMRVLLSEKPELREMKHTNKTIWEYYKKYEPKAIKIKYIPETKCSSILRARQIAILKGEYFKIVRRKKVDFQSTKIVKRPAIIKFSRSDGTIVKFKATKAVKKPIKISFHAKRKKKELKGRGKNG